jgi:hypothetical protein
MVRFALITVLKESPVGEASG